MNAELIKRESMCYTCFQEFDFTPKPEYIELPNSEMVLLRGLLPQDKDAIVELYKSLDKDDRYKRFLGEIASDKAADIGLNATSINSPDVTHDIIVVNENGLAAAYGGFAADGKDPEMHCIVRSGYRGMGLGNRITDELINAATAMGYSKLSATVLIDNPDMINILNKKTGNLKPRCECLEWQLELLGKDGPYVMCGLNGLAHWLADCPQKR